MSDVPMQQDLFGGEQPMSAPQAAAGEPQSVLRVPGWYLVATKRQGPSWWHRLASGAPGGTVITVCGASGRTVVDSSRTITQCPECLAG